MATYGEFYCYNIKQWYSTETQMYDINKTLFAYCYHYYYLCFILFLILRGYRSRE